MAGWLAAAVLRPRARRRREAARTPASTARRRQAEQRPVSFEAAAHASRLELLFRPDVPVPAHEVVVLDVLRVSLSRGSQVIAVDFREPHVFQCVLERAIILEVLT